MEEGLESLQERLGYKFSQPAYLLQALTHSSYAWERGREEMKDNEQLEFLGDAVLELVVRDHLIQRFPDLPEGELSKLRSALVNKRTLAAVARALELSNHLLLGKGEEMTKGRSKTSILADAYEAVVAAIFLDGGLEAAKRALQHHYLPQVSEILREGYFEDYKTRLQELVQGRFKTTPVYRLRHEGGQDHDKIFEFELLIGGRVLGTGVGRTKKEAEQKAAQKALEALKDEL